MRFPFSKKLPKISREEEEKRIKELREAKISNSEKFTMIWTAYLWLFIPSVVILLVIVFLAMWLFGLL